MAIKVVIVEDDPEIRNGFKKLLATTNDLDCIATYEKAESFIAAYNSMEADVVLMDIQLPGMTGIECIEKLKPLEKNTQFLICSVYEDDDNIFNALCAGAVGYVLKNTSPEKLFDSIREVYAGGSPMTGEIARKVIRILSKGQPETAKMPAIDVLTAREKEILGLLAKGYRYKEIADSLFISIKTVRPHIRNIYEKLQVSSRMEAVNKAYGKR